MKVNILKDILGIDLGFFGGNKETFKNLPQLIPEDIAKSPKGNIPPGRVSDPGNANGNIYSFDEDKWLVYPGYQFALIPLIRRLSIGNQSVSQALSNIVNLANTGHTIEFDSDVEPKQVDEMRKEIDDIVPTWHYGIASRHALANKLISQAMISGAMCSETVVNERLDGIYRFLMPYPETIRFKYNKATITYEPYQKTTTIFGKGFDETGLKKLNPNSFKYFAINGDTEQPYGNPPYLPSIGPLEDQKIMLENIKFIIRQVGIMGFWEILVDAPDQKDLETDTAYTARVSTYMNRVKENMKNSYRDGMMVGIKNDHEFKFNSASANASGVGELFQQNELLLSQALKQDPSLAGKGAGAEGNMTIVFTKLISELDNIKLNAAATLQYPYELHLRLKGYKFNWMKVKFKPSTVQDDLKTQQALEIKQRNVRQNRMDGIISPDQHADELGYDKPFKKEPIVPFAPVKSTGDPNLDAEKKKVREKSKDVSDKRVRDKNKIGGTKK